MSHADFTSVASNATPTNLGVSKATASTEAETDSYGNLPQISRDLPEADSGAETVVEGIDSSRNERPASFRDTKVNGPVPDTSTAQSAHAQMVTGMDSYLPDYGYHTHGGTFAPPGLSVGPFGYGAQVVFPKTQPSSSVVQLDPESSGLSVPNTSSRADFQSRLQQTLTLDPDGTSRVVSNADLRASHHARGYKSLSVSTTNTDGDNGQPSTAGLTMTKAEEIAPPSLAGLTAANNSHTQHASEAAASLLSAMANVRLRLLAAGTSTSAAGGRA